MSLCPSQVERVRVTEELCQYMKYTKSYSDKLKVDLRSINEKDAKTFTLKHGYSSSSFQMPEYYDLNGFDKINLKRISWTKKDLPLITKTLDVLTPKGHLSWRTFNFLHPYIFTHLNEVIFEKENWKIINKKLTQDTLVNCYSVPIFKVKKLEKLSGRSILNWLQMAEKDLIKDCVEFKYLTVTDIKNFYPTIYTHSIAWAINGKSLMKISANRKDYNLLGNKLDKLCQNSKDGQTNGIAVGSMTSDILAEIILADVDIKLTEELRKKTSFVKPKDVLILRYRDDYKILSKTSDQGKHVLQSLNKILGKEYDLHINSDKTNTYDDIVEGTFRPWMLEIKASHLMSQIYYSKIPNELNLNFLKDSLLEIYLLQKKYKHGRASVVLLAKLAEMFSNYKKKINIHAKDTPEIIAILRKISILREDVTPHVFLMLDILLNFIKSNVEKRKILNKIKIVITGRDDQDYQLIWFFRLCLSQYPKIGQQILKENTSPFLSVLNNSFNKEHYLLFPEIDNLTIKDKKELSKFSFINRNTLNSLKGVKISPESINPFKY